MKKILLTILPLLLFVRCSKELINFEQMLVERDNVYYTKDTNKPYSGAVFSLYDDGKKKSEGAFKDGKEIERTEWYYLKNGQKRFEETYKDGKQIDSKYWKNESKEVIEKIGKKVEEKINE